MRVKIAVVLCLAAILSNTLVTSGDPVEQPSISFGFPFDCGTVERGVPCLADKFQAGLSVVLVNQKKICHARTGASVIVDDPGGQIEATLLEPVEKCTGGFIAVVGTDPAAIRVISPEDDHNPIPKELELQARELLRAEYCPIADSPPRVLRVGQVALLMFDCERAKAVVLMVNNNIFPLKEGLCTGAHLFFAVNDSLHLTYEAHCCGGGWRAN